MIPVSLPLLILFPLAAGLAIVFAIGLYYAVARRAPSFSLQRTRVFRCVSCGHVYVDYKRRPLVSCPRCRRMNEAVKR